MRIAWAVTCRAYELNADGTADIDGAGVNQLWVAELPADLEVAAVVRLALLEDEHCPLEAHFLAPELAEVQSLVEMITASPRADHQRGFEVPELLPLEFRFAAERPGTYSVELYADRSRESLFWIVHEGAAPSALFAGT